MSMQSDAVAAVALSMGAALTTREILDALNRAYQAGWHDACGVLATKMCEAEAQRLQAQTPHDFTTLGTGPLEPELT
jgi:hypothetical protein